MEGKRQLQIIGDGARGRWLAWQWDDGRLGIEEIDATVALSRLEDALPRPAEDLEALGFDGELARPDLEPHLALALSEALIPAELRRQIREAADDGFLDLHVAPSRQCAQVPWGLLALDDQRRLLDVADISWIGPTLPRDLAPDASPEPAPWEEARELPALHILDPLSSRGQGSVLNPAGTRRWRDLGAGLPAATWRVQTGVGPGTLSALLTERQWSRLFLVAHVGVRQGDTILALSDELSATRLLTGRQDSAEGQGGHHLWPMPPRVAVVACASGLDLAQPEPFGLATAFLANGANTVHATLWTLPTDEAFERRGGPAALSELAVAVDRAQAADHPVAAINAWQRAKLHQWRIDPSLACAPLMWASVATICAPNRRVAGALAMNRA